jgi:DNA repair exonuclease SbcCD ATPase subunit
MDALCINCKWENKPECPFPEPGKYLTCDKHMYWDEPDVKADDEITTLSAEITRLQAENADLRCLIASSDVVRANACQGIERLHAENEKLLDELIEYQECGYVALKIENDTLHKEISDKDKRITELETAIDEVQEIHEEQAGALITVLRGDLAAKDKEIAQLREALEPFAKYYDRLETEKKTCLGAPNIPFYVKPFFVNDKYNLNMIHLREARKALGGRRSDDHL